MYSNSKIGTKSSTGPKLVSLDGNFNKPGLYEVEMGTPFTEITHNMGGGFKVPVKAVQVGGPLGGIVPIDKINDLTLDFESCLHESYPRSKGTEFHSLKNDEIELPIAVLSLSP